MTFVEIRSAPACKPAALPVYPECGAPAAADFAAAAAVVRDYENEEAAVCPAAAAEPLKAERASSGANHPHHISRRRLLGMAAAGMAVMGTRSQAETATFGLRLAGDVLRYGMPQLDAYQGELNNGVIDRYWRKDRLPTGFYAVQRPPGAPTLKTCLVYPGWGEVGDGPGAIAQAVDTALNHMLDVRYFRPNDSALEEPEIDAAYLRMIRTHPIQTNEVMLVCHSMGFIFAMRSLARLRLRGVPLPHFSDVLLLSSPTGIETVRDQAAANVLINSGLGANFFVKYLGNLYRDLHDRPELFLKVWDELKNADTETASGASPALLQSELAPLVGTSRSVIQLCMRVLAPNFRNARVGYGGTNDPADDTTVNEPLAYAAIAADAPQLWRSPSVPFLPNGPVHAQYNFMAHKSILRWMQQSALPCGLINGRLLRAGRM